MVTGKDSIPHRNNIWAWEILWAKGQRPRSKVKVTVHFALTLVANALKSVNFVEFQYTPADLRRGLDKFDTG